MLLIWYKYIYIWLNIGIQVSKPGWFTVPQQVDLDPAFHATQPHFQGHEPTWRPRVRPSLARPCFFSLIFDCALHEAHWYGKLMLIISNYCSGIHCWECKVSDGQLPIAPHGLAWQHSFRLGWDSPDCDSTSRQEKNIKRRKHVGPMEV